MKIRIKTYNGELASYLTVGKVYGTHRIQGERCDINLGGDHYLELVEDILKGNKDENWKRVV